MHVEQLILKYGLPVGFRRVEWSEVQPGQTVFIYGTHRGVGMAYGPHTVVNPTDRTLKNKKGRQFFAMGDVLLVFGERRKPGHRFAIVKFGTLPLRGGIISTHTSIWAAKQKMFELTRGRTQEDNDVYVHYKWVNGEGWTIIKPMVMEYGKAY